MYYLQSNEKMSFHNLVIIYGICLVCQYTVKNELVVALVNRI